MLPCVQNILRALHVWMHDILCSIFRDYYDVFSILQPVETAVLNFDKRVYDTMIFLLFFFLLKISQERSQ